MIHRRLKPIYWRRRFVAALLFTAVVAPTLAISTANYIDYMSADIVRANTSTTVDYAFTAPTDGTHQYGESSSAIVPATGSGSVEAWVYFAGTARQGTIVSAGNGFHISTYGDMRMRAGNSWDTNYQLPIGRWVHVALTWAGPTSAAATLYADGYEVASTANAFNVYPGGSGGTPAGFRVGRQWGTYGEEFPGMIDEVRVWNARRTQSEVETNMHSRVASHANLLAYYDFNQSSGSTVNLAGGSTSNVNGALTLYNTPTFTELAAADTSSRAGLTVRTFTRSYITAAGGWTVPFGVASVESLVVGGGGGGGSHVGGGGGAGGVRSASSTAVSDGSVVTVKVGMGGRAGRTMGPADGAIAPTNGQSSVFSSVTSLGGGSGASFAWAAGGGSGTVASGGGGNGCCTHTTGGAGTAGQGFAGGNGGAFDQPHATGGGGGAGATGGSGVQPNLNSSVSGNGGTGVPSSITGTATYYGGGGGGSAHGRTGSNPWVPGTPGQGGLGGGGDGSVPNGANHATLDVIAESGTANTGGGGGGAAAQYSNDAGSIYTLDSVGGTGGSGVVIIAYSTTICTASAPTDVTIGGIAYRYIRYTTPDTNSVDGNFNGDATCGNTWTVPAGVTSADVLVVAGGGGAGFTPVGSENPGGGGGGGGVIYDTIAVTAGSDVAVAVGKGGAGGTTSDNTAPNGANSVLGSLTAIGGGGGAKMNQIGANGGSGGGGGAGSATGSSAGGQTCANATIGLAGGTGTATQGNDASFRGCWGWGGSGGGAGSPSYISGNGATLPGHPLTVSITGSQLQVGAGGRGNGYSESGDPAAGSGGGGQHTYQGANGNGRAGASGTVIVRWAVSAQDELPNTGLFARYRAGDYDATNKVWADSSGNGRHVNSVTGVVTGTPTLSIAGGNGNGASVAFPVVSGGSSAATTPTDWIQFPSTVLPNNYTLQTIARHATGADQTGRIFNSQDTLNWLSGFWGGKSGVAYHGPTGGAAYWITQFSSSVHGSDWVLSSDHQKSASANAKYRSQGVDRTVGNNGLQFADAPRLSINKGYDVAPNNYDESSDWQVADILVYDSTLTTTQLRQNELYLNRLYGIETPGLQATGVSAAKVASSSTSLSVSWTRASDDTPAAQTLQQSTDGTNWSNATTSASVTGTSTSATVTGLTGGTNYYFRVLTDLASVTNEVPSATSTAAAPYVATTTALTNSASPTSGSAVTLTATITPAPAGGTVAFTAGGTTITGCGTKALTGGVATCSWTPGSAGATSVVATYTPDAASLGSSDTKSITVLAATTLALTNSASPTVGSAVTLTATLTPSTTGNIAFTAGGSTISGCASVALSAGVATCSWTPGSAGATSVVATFAATASHATSSDTKSITVLATTSLALTYSASPTEGQAATLTATLTPSTTGNVAFAISGTPIAGCTSVALSSGVATCSWTPPSSATYSVTATFTATASHAGSTDTESIVVAAATPGAVTNLTATPRGPGRLSLAWTAAGAPVTDYEIQYAAAGSGSWTTFADGVGTGTTATINDLASDTRYDVRVRAKNGAVAGNWSSTVTKWTHITRTETFTDVGNSSWAVPRNVDLADVLVVGGGGGGAPGGSAVSSTATYGGGGAGGGVNEQLSASVTAGSSIAVTVGAGGLGGIGRASSSSITNATAGGASSFGSVTAIGGAAGSTPAGSAGSVGAGGAASGGGGAGGAGLAAASGNNGSNGTTSALTGTSVCYGGGGGGGAATNGGTGGCGGTGPTLSNAQRGSAGGTNSQGASANTGHGGGGGYNTSSGGTGGSGLVFVRFAVPVYFSATSLGNGTAHSAYSGSVTGYGRATPLVYSAIGLPAGVSINASSGAVTGTPTVSGDYTAVVRVTDADGFYTTESLDFNIAKANQTLTFTYSGNKTYGDADFSVQATVTSGLLVAFTTDTPSVCTVTGDSSPVGNVTGAVVSVLKAGTCNLTAAQAGNAGWNPATSVTRSFTVASATQAALTLVASTAVTFGDTVTLGTTGGSGTGAVSYSLVGGTGTAQCAIASGVLAFSSAGTCVVRATKAADDRYSAANATDKTITVAKASQSVTFTSTVPTTPVAGGSYTLTATATSSLTASFSIATGSPAVCSLSGSVVTFVSSGRCEVAADQSGNGSYEAASRVTQVISVGQRNQNIAFAQPADMDFGDADVSLGITASSNLVVTVVSETASVCTITGDIVSIVAVGECSIKASQAGNSTWAAASDVTRKFDVRASLPTAPSITSISAANASITLGFTAPSFTGGSTIVGYRVVVAASGGAATTFDTCTTSPCTIDGLTNGTEYTATVAARNVAGVGPASNASPGATPVSKATAPTAIAAVPGPSSLTVTWTEPETLGGGAFVEYQLRIRVKGQDWSTTAAATITSLSTVNHTFTGLSNGLEYEVQIVTITTANATAVVGNTGEMSAVPVTTPSAPRDLTIASTGAGTIRVAWAEPLRDGGAAVTSYTVTVDNAATCGTVTISTATRVASCDVANLVAGTKYTVTVKAVNRVGAGDAATETYTAPAVASAAVEVPAPTTVVETPKMSEPRTAPKKTTAGTTAKPKSGTAVAIAADGSKIAPRTTVRDGKVAASLGKTAIVLAGAPGSNVYTNASGQLVVEIPGRVLVTGKGLKPGTSATVWLMSTPTLLGYATIDKDGTLAKTFTLPANLAAGQHTIQVEVLNAAGVEVNLAFGLSATRTSVPVTGGDPWAAGAWALILVALGAVLLLVIRRSREHIS